MTTTEHRTTQVVIDNSAYAWDESHQQALHDLRNTFGDDLVEAHEAALRQAAHQLIETHLRTQWRTRGYHVAFNDSGHTALDDTTYHQVWQTAADAISDRDLVLAADLGHVFVMNTELEMHRAALLHRLYEWASGDMCDRAEQQFEGLLAAVENAKTRAQLIAIGESFA